jgi:hypothetical protein
LDDRSRELAILIMVVSSSFVAAIGFTIHFQRLEAPLYYFTVDEQDAMIPEQKDNSAAPSFALLGSSHLELANLINHGYGEFSTCSSFGYWDDGRVTMLLRITLSGR